MKLYVGNLDYAMTDTELRALFSQHGTITSAQIINDHFTRQSKCFGYVEITDSTDGHEAIKTLHGKKIYNQPLIVKEARPRDERKGSGW